MPVGAMRGALGLPSRETNHRAGDEHGNMKTLSVLLDINKWGQLV